MTAANFPSSLRRILRSEGGKVDDPRDPGGRTNQGVTQRVYDGFRVRTGQPKLDVFKMSAAERDGIYKRQYWDSSRCDSLPPGVDLVVFDGAVNSGPVQSIKWLQRALRPYGYDGPIDGFIGESTIATAVKTPSPGRLIAEIGEARLRFMRSLKTWKFYSKGWTARVKSVTLAGQALSKGKPEGDISVHLYEAEGKADIGYAVSESPKAAADAATGAGTLTTVLAQTTDSLLPLSYSSERVSQIVLVLTLIGVAVTVGGIVWGLWARRKNAERANSLDLVE